MARVELQNIVKQYDAQEAVTLTGYKGPPALDKVNMTIEDGETVSVVGPSGCGKSTLLKVVAGLEYPNGGRVLYDGQDFTEIKPQDRGIGMVFQDYALYPAMKGKGNLQYFFEVHKRTPEEQEAMVKQTAELMGMGFELLLGRVPDTLSGGEKQRVAIARCIIRDPHLFLMDEPISNLDAKLRERTRIEVKKLLRKFKVTTLYVTHDQQEAIFMADRIAVMRAGILQQIGTFDDLYYSPANAFVASFIGTPPMRLMQVVVEGRQVSIGSARWDLPGHLAGSIPPGLARLGVRPEGWLQDTPDGAELVVRHIERLPTEQASFVQGAIQGQSTVVLAPLDITAVQSLRVTPDWERAYFFASEDDAVLHAPGVPDLF